MPRFMYVEESFLIIKNGKKYNVTTQIKYSKDENSWENTNFFI